ncbi:hypothetical protein C8K38_111188 [Rhodococcus sp. OK611]|uniref:hypothetical protein n=1 Tax=unclassified Rhodococcus (in: high G+C Gram-positive bacteria) TaxID=192944 RepID=UPI000BD7AD56|nr:MULTISPECIES: hypothetical protein [unclassified Rhodococcus (in: high G+C Gram-positive bacteria)]PTR42019.1 hypothetical protein C8K38_111188 [Rhodococcus sp. OK611]SNX91534.1 hypothetical protein SAMN05447004_11069 [Rhodococcus sp. OK270]
MASSLPERTPDGTLNGLGGIAAWASKTEAQYKAEQRGRIELKANPIAAFVGNITNALLGIFNPTGHFAGIGQWAQAKQADIATLQDKTQKLEGVVGYCHTYSSGGSSNAIAGDIRIPIDNQIGPIVGATIANGAIYLASKGLWVADLQLTAEGYTALGSTYINIQIRVYAPNGTLHAHRIAEADTSSRESLVVHVPFTIPSAGYYAELWCNAAFGRGSRGGSVWNGMSVEKRSSETS